MGNPNSMDASDLTMVNRVFQHVLDSHPTVFLAFDFVSYPHFTDHPAQQTNDRVDVQIPIRWVLFDILQLVGLVSHIHDFSEEPQVHGGYVHHIQPL